MNKLIHLIGAILLLASAISRAEEEKPPVRIAIFGLTHDHALGFLSGKNNWKEVQLAGIIEPDKDLVARYSRRFNLDSSLFFASLDELLAKTNIQAVATFTSTFDHKRVVELCAPHGITVMVEKPLAVNMEHARAIETAAKKGNIQVIVNYETTWYPGNHAAYATVHDPEAKIGEIRKIVVHDGHRGPKEIGCSADFLAWLTDPVLNGGGALNDFGCYGADLATWLMGGQKPTSVFAVTQRIKADIYPKVEDEATIVLTYPKAQAILQASWNWPFDRKDIEIYGKSGYVLVPRANTILVRSPGAQETTVTPPPLSGANVSSVAYLSAVARGQIKPSGLSSLDVNMTVVEILDAAHQSARTGKRVDL